MNSDENPAGEQEQVENFELCSEADCELSNLDECDIDISDILRPEESDVSLVLPVPAALVGDSLEGGSEPLNAELSHAAEEQSFLYVHQEQRPLVNEQLEFYSSRAERIKMTRPRLPDLAAKKAAQKRIRIIILVDIVLFIVILAVIYPSLRNLQSNGRLADYRFSLSLNTDRAEDLINIVVKVEKLAGKESEPAEGYEIQATLEGEVLLDDFRNLPDMSSPVNYALFSIAYQDFPRAWRNTASGIDIDIRLGRLQKKFYLLLPKMEQ